MIEHLKRMGIGLACVGAFSIVVAIMVLTWWSCRNWPISAGIVFVVLLSWIVGTLVKT